MSFYGLSLYLKARPALVQRNQQLPQDLAGCGRGNAGGVQRGGQFVEVRTHDVGLGHGANGFQQLQKAHAAGLRGAGAGEAGGVQAVEVDGQVNGHLAGTELLSELGKAREIELVHLGVGSCELEFGAVTAADAELVDAPVADEVMAAAQDTGVAELCAQIVVPQVGVGIKVDDVEVGVFFHHGPHGTQRDQMLAAQQERELAVVQDLCRAALDVGQCEEEYDLIIVDSSDPFGPSEGLFTREFYGSCFNALKEDGIMVNQQGSPFYAEDANAMQRSHKRIASTFPISRVYQAHIPTFAAGYWLFGFASKKYHPIDDLDATAWKALNMRTRYYTTKLHIGAFYLPAFLEEMLREVEEH